MAVQTGSELTELRVEVPESGEVSALMLRPRGARCLLVFGHGAGAGMTHAFMNAMAHRLADRRIATFRYQFPYMERGRSFPDKPAVLVRTVRAAVVAAGNAASDLPLVAGGKSMGGRMSSQAASNQPLGRTRGLVFFGFPLHPAGKPGTERAEHLSRVPLPMLFLQGTRDKLADLDLLRPVVDDLGQRAKLHVVDGADHGFHVLKRSGRTDEEVLDDLARSTEIWVGRLLG